MFVSFAMEIPSQGNLAIFLYNDVLGRSNLMAKEIIDNKIQPAPQITNVISFAIRNIILGLISTAQITLMDMFCTQMEESRHLYNLIVKYSLYTTTFSFGYISFIPHHLRPQSFLRLLNLLSFQVIPLSFSAFILDRKSVV